jgi:glycine dehydrogenase subunit 1
MHCEVVKRMPVHPYIPNSVPAIKKRMLERIGVASSDELFSCIPDSMKLHRPLNLASPLSEQEVARHIETTLEKNHKAPNMLSFLGAGCWPHFIPALCNEINSRSEFVTAYTGDVYTDLGRYQALFEFQSLIGELVGLDGVGFPLYDWPTACGDAARMAISITGRRELLVPASVCPEKLSVMRAHCNAIGEFRKMPIDLESGQIDLESLEQRIGKETAAVYIENPTYLGFIESQAEEIGKIAHDNGALFLVGVEPLSLGLLRPPGDYGADIVCGEGQPLGMPMSFGGALMGFLAFRDEVKYVEASGNRMITITTTQKEGEHGFAYIMPERTIFCSRDKAPTSTGTASVLWAITAAVYLSLLGPQGLRKLAQTIMENSHFAMKRLSEIKNIEAPAIDAVHFKEFTVRFRESKPTVSEINKKLLGLEIIVGKPLTNDFPELGNSALYCVTEVHTEEDIERLASSIKGVMN